MGEKNREGMIRAAYVNIAFLMVRFYQVNFNKFADSENDKEILTNNLGCRETETL